MDEFSERLGLVIRIFALLFCWLIIMLYVSPELAVIIALGLIGLWLAFFVPVAILKNAFRPKLPNLPMHPAESDYLPPSYSPAPEVVDAFPDTPTQGGSMVVSESTNEFQLPDMLPDYPAEELPQHSYYDPPPENNFFRRSLLLPIAGILMIAGVWQNQALQDLLVQIGLHQPDPIAWDKLTAPPELRAEQASAARLALRREGLCESISSGRVAPADQLARKKSEAFVYEFSCHNVRFKPQEFLVWVTPTEIPTMPWPSLEQFRISALPTNVAQENCEASLGALLKPLNVAADPTIEPKFTAYASNMPFRGYLRGYLEQAFIKGDGSRISITASCWIPPVGETTARLVQ